MPAAGKKERPILVEGRNCWRIARAKRAAFLVDAQSYFAALVAAVERATRSILIAGWDIDSRIRLLRDDGGHKLPVGLGDFLNAAASGRRGLHIHILGWDFAMIYALERELFPVFKLDWQGHRRVHFRLDGRHPVGASHHQKIVVVDDAIAFVGGIDLTRRRWDTCEHRPGDPRRVDPEGEHYPPFHDVQVAVNGAAASALGDLVRERWRRGTGYRLHPPERADDDPWPPGLPADMEDVEVGIARTEPSYKGNSQVREVEALYLDAISAAQRFIYIENQYLTSASIGEALAARLGERDGPEIVIVLPKESSGWLEQSTMDACRARMLERLREKDRFGRLHTYYPFVPGLGDEGLNLHAKVLVIDDRLVRVGSSNLSNRSMGLDTECDLAIDAAGDIRIAKAIAGFRNRLLAEHLGIGPEKVSETVAVQGSLVKAVEKLRGPGRSLRPLSGQVPGWMKGLIPETAIADPERPIDPEKFIDQFIPDDLRKPAYRRLWRIAILLLCMLGLAGAWHWTPLGDWISLETAALAHNLRGNPAAPFIMVAAYLLGSLLLVPVTLLIIGTAFIFGPLGGMSYSLLGSILGAVLTYGIGRILERDTVRLVAGSQVNRLSRRLGRHGLITTTIVRLLPIAPFTVVNLVAGASHIRFRDFLFGTALGMAPGILAITVFGHRLEIAIREPATESLVVLAAVALLIVLAGMAARRWLGGNGDPGTGARSHKKGDQGA